MFSSILDGLSNCYQNYKAWEHIISFHYIDATYAIELEEDLALFYFWLNI